MTHAPHPRFGTDIVPVEVSASPALLFRATEPTAVIDQATKVANALADVIRKQVLFKHIGNKDHVLVEAWTLCGSMLGVFPICVWSRPVEYGGVQGWEARVEARTMQGQVIGAAEAACMRDEENWSSRADYALRSMAQTRATSKALRLPLGFVMTLAGFDATPYEEMDGVIEGQARVVNNPPRSGQAGGFNRGQPQGGAEGRPVLPATESQLKAIYAIARGAQAMDDAEVEARCKELYGVTPSALSRRQASEFIDALKGGTNG
jgi:hypothetical protein